MFIQHICGDIGRRGNRPIFGIILDKATAQYYLKSLSPCLNSNILGGRKSLTKSCFLERRYLQAPLMTVNKLTPSSCTKTNYTVMKGGFDNTYSSWKMLKISCFQCLVAFDCINFRGINFHSTT